MSLFARLSLTCGFALAVLTSQGQQTQAGEIGYVEDFALAKDRAEALKQLIPGTEDYFYFHCLHFQHLQQFDKVDEMLTRWIKRYRDSAKIREIQNRQALFLYDQNPRRAIDLIRGRLNLQFNHQRELRGVKPNLPTALDPKLIARDALTANALRRHSNLNGFEDSSFDWLVQQKFDRNRRRHLLSWIQRPDYHNLVQLVLADINDKYTGGFGSLPIHSRLLPDQLDTLVKAKPELLNQQAYVNARLMHLRPASHVDWQNDPKAHQAFLTRLWNFVKELGPVHNSLKVNVLYHQLELDRANGKYDKQRFMAYIKLPRRVGYVNPKYLNRPEHVQHIANLGANYSSYMLLAPIGNDEPLVRSYFQHLFLEESSTKPYEPYVSDVYLRRQLAETKIVNGLGNAEQWSALLSPSEFKALKDRIDIDFAYTRKPIFGADEAVSVDLHVKNVKTMIVKVFEINTKNYYQDHLSPVNTDINLDGLVANSETTHDYKEPPLRRVKRHFEFPHIKKRGVYVLDFIGNGKSSRVLIRKGKLQYVARTSTAGHIFTVMNHKNEHVKKASILLAGREYAADKNGRITVPFSNNPGTQPIVLTDGEFSTLDYFNQESENYSLTAGIHVDRESLLNHRKATVVIRPALKVNGTPVTLSVLEDVRLTITSTDHDGVTATKEVKDFELFEDKESTFEFQVPNRLHVLRFTLQARVKNLSQNNTVTLSDTQTFQINSIARSDKTEDLHLLKASGQFILELLGRTGEALPERAVRVTLKHRDFRDHVVVSLQTNDRGRINLGSLADIVSVRGDTPQNVSKTWTLPQDARTYYQTRHAIANQPFQVPFIDLKNEPTRDRVSLLEYRGSGYIRDAFETLSIKNGMLHVSGLPAGEYGLWFKRPNRHVRIRVIDGEYDEGYVLGETRHLEVRSASPLHIQNVTSDKESVKVRLWNASPFSRVHVIATRYVPAFSVFANFARVVDAEPYLLTKPRATSRYVAGRNIGDEYRYIIDRKYARKFPGNMLQRPSVLLNPWAIRSTSTGVQDAAAGDAFAPSAADGKRGQSRPSNGQGKLSGSRTDFANLDFLADSSVALLNIRPNADGTVTVPLKDLGDNQHIHVIAVDPQQTVYRSISRPEPETVGYKDLRLVRHLPLDEHFTQQKRVSVLAAGQQFKLADITSSRFEAYDSIANIIGLYVALSKNTQLVDFGFLANWPSLDFQAKKEKYSKYACHELNFFLYKKDKAFFNDVIKGYLANKHHKTFMDDFLLGNDLAGYRQPWQYARLNTVERILLAERLKGESKYARQFIGDQLAMLPPNLERFEFLYNSALGSNALDTTDKLGYAGARGEAKKEFFQRLKNAEKQVRQQQGQAAPGDYAKGLARFGRDMPAPPRSAAPRPSAGPAMDDERRSVSRNFAGKEMDKSVVERAKKRKLAADGTANRPFGGRGFGGMMGGSGGGFGAAPGGKGDVEDGFFTRDANRRREARQYYQKLDKTQEWAENNYYHLPIEQQNANLVTVSSFWNDYANRDADKPFFSVNFTQASRNFAEMLMALAVLDLPFESKDHKSKFNEGQMELVAGSPMVVFHQEIRESEKAEGQTPILVSQNFFRNNDRYRVINGERVDKYVSKEFLTHTVYGCQIVVTNPTSSRQKLNVLVQVPQGAVPVLNSKYTRSVPMNLNPFSTQTLEYHFYFPTVGTFPHYPVHVAKNEKLIAFAAAKGMKVVDTPSEIDKQSWDFVSQDGSDEDVINYLKVQNLLPVKLDRIAFRMKDKPFFDRVIAILNARHVYNHTLWSYGVSHNDPNRMREFLKHANSFVNQCGAAIESTLLAVNPVERRTYQHLDYSPLVNARAHQLGKRRQILNDRLNSQYHSLLRILSYRRELLDEDLLAVTYYMILQDRIDEAFEFFNKIQVNKLAARIQYDYFAAYLDLFSNNPTRAVEIAKQYRNYPVPRWRAAFAQLDSALQEIGLVVAQAEFDEKTAVAALGSKAALALAGQKVGGDPGADPAETSLADKDEDRNEKQTNLAKSEPSLDFKVESKKIQISYQNVANATIKFYEMDIELLFSRNPFVQRFSGAFSYIRPNVVKQLKLSVKNTSATVDLPKEFHNSNVMVEITSGGITKTQTYYSNSLNAQVIENYGQVRVTDKKTKRPLPKVYVKVYALMKNGQIKFFKDGYTDLRGRFDYTSLNTNELDFAQRFSVLVLSETHGAMVREASPPKR